MSFKRVLFYDFTGTLTAARRCGRFTYYADIDAKYVHPKKIRKAVER